MLLVMFTLHNNSLDDDTVSIHYNCNGGVGGALAGQLVWRPVKIIGLFVCLAELA